MVSEIYIISKGRPDKNTFYNGNGHGSLCWSQNGGGKKYTSKTNAKKKLEKLADRWKNDNLYLNTYQIQLTNTESIKTMDRKAKLDKLEKEELKNLKK